MALSDSLGATLLQAIQDYDFPFVTYDFEAQHEIRHPSMREVEATIRDQLLSRNLEAVKNGLSNVLYWGYARTGYRSTRVNNFRQKVSESQLRETNQFFQNIEGPGVYKIAHIHMPEFGGLAFVSKTRMFLDPSRYVVLDWQLLKLREQQRPNIFHEVKIGSSENMIRVTRYNEGIYDKWSSLCRRIAAQSFTDADIRAVDIERGVFHLVQTKRANHAAEILENA